MLKQLKLALKIIDDKRCYSKDYEGVTSGYSEYEYGDQFPPIKTKILNEFQCCQNNFVNHISAMIFLLWNDI